MFQAGLFFKSIKTRGFFFSQEDSEMRRNAKRLVFCFFLFFFPFYLGSHRKAAGPAKWETVESEATPHVMGQMLQGSVLN